MLKKDKKDKVIKEHQLHETDTGSADVQVAVLSESIEKLLSHLKKSPKDNHSRRGLLKMIVKRKKLLKYLEKEDKRRYNALIKKIGMEK